MGGLHLKETDRTEITGEKVLVFDLSVVRQGVTLKTFRTNDESQLGSGKEDFSTINHSVYWVLR